MKKLIATVAAILMAAVCVYAQNRITGRLVDENGVPVSFADIIVKTADGQVKAGGITNENGEFTFEPGDGKFIIEASSIGYSKLTISVSGGELGDLLMPQDIEQLAAASVQSQRTVEKAGHFLIVPDPKEVLSAGRGIDLLSMQQLPGLRVDRGLKNITVDGGTPVFKINGREVSLARINNLDPARVKRIEYTNNPGIRYLDRGATGVINIVLTDADDGGNAYAQAESAVNTGFINAYGNAAYHKGKSEFALEYGFNKRNYSKGPSYDKESYISDERKVEREYTMDVPVRYTTNNLSGEYTFMANDSTMFIAQFSMMEGRNHNSGDGHMTRTEDGISEEYDSYRSLKRQETHPKMDLFYSHGMGKGQKLELNAVAEYSKGENSLENVYSRPSGVEQYLTSVMNNGWALSTEAVYNRQIAKTDTRWGVQYQHNDARNNYNAGASKSRMTKDNAYVFAQADGRIGQDAGWTVGTGAKIFAVKDGDDSKTYVRNLSTAQLNWRISDSWSFTGSVRYSPSLPSLGSLSPYLFMLNDVEGQQGYPGLKPAENLDNRVMLRYASKKGWFANLSTGYDRSFNDIISAFRYDPQTKLFISVPQNSDRSYTAYTAFETGFKNLFGHLNVTLDGKYMKQESKGEGFHHTNDNFTANINVQGVWEKFNVGAYFNLKPEWTLSGEYLGKSEQGQNIYAQYKHNNLTVSLNWLCPFNSKGFSYETRILSDVHPGYHINYTSDNGNSIVLGLSWYFETGKKFNKGSKTLNNGGYDRGSML